MKINFTLKAILLLLLCSTFSFAQQKGNSERKIFGKTVSSINPNNGLIKCVSSEYEASLQEKNADRQSQQEFEQWLAPLIEAQKAKMQSQRNVNETQVVVTIPVVVHIIHSGQAVGSTRNISDARVLSQITVLNQDFRRMTGTPGFNSNAVGADTEIQFCMAQRTPAGLATNGIDRVNLGSTTWSETNVEGTLKPQTIWDPTKYFNIWVCQFGGDLNGVLGYAQFPSNSGLSGLSSNGGSANTDGLVIDWRCFGTATLAPGSYFTDYDKGRTATHEIGHCFGLRHIWGDLGDRQSNSLNCNGTDYCADTPTAGWENYDCNQVYDSCPSSAGNDMVENYMDYTNDICMNIFTQNQKTRMLTVLQNSPRRNSLLTSNACQSLSTSEFNLFNSIFIYPNPVNELLTISVENSIDLPSNYTIYNQLGQVIATKNILNNSDLSITTSSLSNGVYFIKVDKDNDSKTMKFLKN